MKAVLKIEDLAGVHSGKVTLEEMRKELDEMRSREAETRLNGFTKPFTNQGGGVEWRERDSEVTRSGAVSAVLTQSRRKRDSVR